MTAHTAEPTSGPLAALAARYNAALARERDATAELAQRAADDLAPLAGVRLAGHLLPMRPLLVPRGTAQRAARAVRRTVLTIARALEDPTVVRALPGLDVLLQGRVEPPVRRPGDLDVVRPDGVLAPDGTYSIMEVNVGSCVGGLIEIERLARAMEAWAARALAPADARALRWPRPATALARAVAARLGRGARVAWTALPAAFGALGAQEQGDALCELLAREGLAARAAPVTALRYDGARVRLEGQPVDAIYRLVDPVDWLLDPRIEPLRDAVTRGHVALYTSPYDLLANHKGALAALSASPAPLPAGAARVPWTRAARPQVDSATGRDVLPFVREHARDYVLKPGSDCQGRRVRVGRDDPDRFAQHLVAAVLADDCVVQEYLAPPRAALPYRLDHGEVELVHDVRVVTSPVLVRGAPASLCARTSVPGGGEVLTHPFAGTTGLVPVVEVDPSALDAP